jgi:hypothetical protein
MLQQIIKLHGVMYQMTVVFFSTLSLLDKSGHFLPPSPLGHTANCCFNLPIQLRHFLSVHVSNPEDGSSVFLVTEQDACLEPSLLTEVFRGFLRSLQPKAGIVPQTSTLYFKYFPKHHLSVIITMDAIYCHV